MKLKDFLEKQLASGKLTWNSKSELIRASGNNINGHNNKILEEYKSKFKFGFILYDIFVSRPLELISDLFKAITGNPYTKSIMSL